MFNTFATIIRYADRGDLNKSIYLAQIEGIGLIDEIDAHMHTSLQYEVLPQLCKLFPKVQFIITSHAPLFLLGMEKLYGSDGIQIIELPTGVTISTERFSEFQKSFECYQQTRAFEDTVQRSVEEQLRRGSKPLVLTEGKTDAQYIRTALELLNRGDLLNALDIEGIGTPGSANESGSGSGKGALSNAAAFLTDNPRFITRPVLILYDHDAKKRGKDLEKIRGRSIPPNSANTWAENGVENLLPESLYEEVKIEEKFFSKKQHNSGYRLKKVIPELNKQALCDFLCIERRSPDDFVLFSVVCTLLEEFLNTSIKTGGLREGSPSQTSKPEEKGVGDAK